MTSTNPTAEDDRRLGRLRLQGLRLPLGLRPLLVGRRLGHNIRPICLLNVSFEIITKILMLRFEDCMNRIIHRCQSAFIKGRNIMDGVLTLHEILHDVKIKKKGWVNF
jgi:hypothetical protein